jgi:hypothetical protein
MENICSFEPLWKDFEADVPQKHITKIRLKALELFLRENRSAEIHQPPNLDCKYLIIINLLVSLI